MESASIRPPAPAVVPETLYRALELTLQATRTREQDALAQLADARSDAARAIADVDSYRDAAMRATDEVQRLTREVQVLKDAARAARAVALRDALQALARNGIPPAHVAQRAVQALIDPQPVVQPEGALRSLLELTLKALDAARYRDAGQTARWAQELAQDVAETCAAAGVSLAIQDQRV